MRLDSHIASTCTSTEPSKDPHFNAPFNTLQSLKVKKASQYKAHPVYLALYLQ